jgi:ribose 5-phosphate isomerase B
VRGIRAAQCYDVFTAHRARMHNNAQICCLAAEEGDTKVKVIVEDFLKTEFEGGRHQKRLDKITAIEDKQCL